MRSGCVMWPDLRLRRHDRQRRTLRDDHWKRLGNKKWRYLLSRNYLDRIVRMLRFDWDEKKNRSNRSKHGIWFVEAQTVCDDPHGRLFVDPEHSDERNGPFLLERVRQPG